MRRNFGIAGVVGLVLVVAGVAGSSATRAQQVKPREPIKGAAVVPAAEAIDPRGEPKQAAVKAIPGPKVCVSYTDKTWQVMLKPGNVDWTKISGDIEVIGGELSKVIGFANLETKKKEHADRGRYTKKRIDFELWVKEGGTDSFRFQVTDATELIRCNFRISGGPPITESVLIGKSARHPSRGDFTLRAHPDNPAPAQ